MLNKCMFFECCLAVFILCESIRTFEKHSCYLNVPFIMKEKMTPTFIDGVTSKETNRE